MKPINNFLDYTLLKADAILSDIEKLCKEGIENNTYSVCINPFWVKNAKDHLQGSKVKLCSVVGFPLGSQTSETKAFEARQLAKIGVDELDMVLNIGAFKSGDYKTVQKDIEGVGKAAPQLIIKVIIETCLLTNEEKKIACEIVKSSGAHFVKTSTGFSKSGATIQDIKLLRECVGPSFGVKASGGIKDRATALKMLEAGASRIGSSSLLKK